MHDSTLRVLTYHRVIDPGDPAALSPAQISATPESFDRQMRHLSRRYNVVSAEETLSALREGRPLPRRAVLLTFDDAYHDFGDIAWPILRRYRLPAVVFVPTAYPGDPSRVFWWDRLYCAVALTSRTSVSYPPLGTLPLGTLSERHGSLRRVREHLKSVPHDQVSRDVEWLCGELKCEAPVPARVLSWAELRTLAREGVTFAAHTRTHPALTRLATEEARREIRGSREDLRHHIGEVPPIFAYPFGIHDDRVLDVVRQEGFEMAVTTLHGQNQLSRINPLRLHRLNVGLRTTPSIFRLRLLSIFSQADTWLHRSRGRGRPSIATEGSAL